MATVTTLLLSVPTQTERLTPDSRRTQTPPKSTTGAIGSFPFLATTVATIKMYFQSFPYHTNGALVQSSMTDIGYYIRITSRQISKTTARTSLFSTVIWVDLWVGTRNHQEITTDNIFTGVQISNPISLLQSTEQLKTGISIRTYSEATES
jgi:hypothetical protein